MITNPKFSLRKDNHEVRCPWKRIERQQPMEIYVKLKLNKRSIKLTLLKNSGLLRTDFSLEELNKNLESLQRLTENIKKCYYYGKINSLRDSRVALSVCDGLVSIRSLYFLIYCTVSWKSIKKSNNSRNNIC